VFRDDAGDGGVICKVHRQSEPLLEAHKDPRPRNEISFRDAGDLKWGTADKLVSRQVSGETPRD
jgi:hypothetical protein